ncbi:MAG: TonB-dependent receptor [Pseudomonadota bacterium]
MTYPSSKVRYLTVCVALLVPVPALACSSCGCTLSPDWENQGLSSTPGWRVDLRYDYINQNQLRHGSGTASNSDIANALVNGSVAETEQITTNHYYTLGVDYSPNRDWGFNLQVPYVDRNHSTLSAGDNENTYSHTQSLGDIKLIARYQGFSPDGDTGIQFGLKLPTGKHDYTFSSGPGAGTLLDRSLQPGSGSTDLILGVYRYGTLNKNWDWFAQGLFQASIQTLHGYRPGNAVNLNTGVRYMAYDKIVPQLQINAQTRQRDTGANADPANTGGKLVYLSPGLTVTLNKSTKIYGFIQIPVYQYVEGLQLAPRWNASVGLNFSL